MLLTGPAQADHAGAQGSTGSGAGGEGFGGHEGPFEVGLSGIESIR
ncbi:hypothetical protein N136_03480 [Leifsonia aquatica ATCC 14665]|uniref:Uncharacterized protein n=1 Tax=Leifsonia aquatica ATCC 14665 TaxID=1358026 RepID=U2RMV8_LEIAQ|nr:hypothetical protein N136_03480 [Leifsonia aquatica ATCC 14665]